MHRATAMAVDVRVDWAHTEEIWDISDSAALFSQMLACTAGHTVQGLCRYDLLSHTSLHRIHDMFDHTPG